ncbi:MAG: ATPase AAA-2 domain protein [candidate division CPR1 bacterium GW2011_GWC1_49_13]|uniref:ATPase AAA-2 domain protein n=1 Tax=candidate division CPR1 bacterium GW2011_GWC1_49_13 TaxID=1618342 RepID=A0A0G1VFN6_9BACT|nr:MAG: ATPase AAA-2 domain protein [candidate division CPR1 bacterium GW2011_GWC1_49_13]
MICQNCGKRQAVFQTHQLVEGRPTIVYLCEVCAEEFRSGAQSNRTTALEQYGRDITAMAEEGKLDPVIGRKKEIERVIHILSRRTKNNPVLIGDPGVGKTAIVEGLAQKIVDGDIPESLNGKRIISLDLALMLAGASHRGEFEERLKQALEEVTKARGEIILFIDELHTVVGAGAAQGAIDASNMLKPSLARGELQCVGATTLDEYRRHIEKDGALERRFQPVVVKEPSQDETFEILKGLRPNYEEHHRVRISDEALKAAVTLSSRYIADRFLPDKSIDLLDEASAQKRLREMATDPAALSRASEEMRRLKSKPRKTLAEMERIEELSLMEKEKVGSWRPNKMESIPEVTAQDVAKVTASITGIPVEDLSEDERKRLTNLEKKLHESIVGQDAAVMSVSSAIRRARAGLKDPNRPVGSFIFLGPTGVGKTELARALAEALYGDESMMVRLDMSEYGERHTVSRMIGSPPGYVGYEDAGQLTEVVRRKPFSIILFDEIEKAHPDVFNILLQILEDGRLTDAHGRTVDFKNTILIMTSNVGTADLFESGVGFGEGKRSRDYEAIKDSLTAQLQKSFRPEFLNRIDDVIVFHPLDEGQVRQIADILLKESNKRLLQSHEMSLVVSVKARNYLAKRGFNPELGARPLRRLIQREVEDPISNGIVSGEYGEGDLVAIDLLDDKLSFRVKKKARVKV